jgi:hypothetical protein
MHPGRAKIQLRQEVRYILDLFYLGKKEKTQLCHF